VYVLFSLCSALAKRTMFNSSIGIIMDGGCEASTGKTIHVPWTVHNIQI
jgi:hypothetical protein